MQIKTSRKPSKVAGAYKMYTWMLITPGIIGSNQYCFVTYEHKIIGLFTIQSVSGFKEGVAHKGFIRG